ncbi:response regulator transcription factor [bacterium]|nr:MAG: response regulator transcription factor [bacterium]
MKKIRILLADDHALVREGMKTLLQDVNDLFVAGEASDGLEVIQKIKDLSPDIVIMDISMPRMTGLEATDLIQREFPKTKVLIVTMHENKDYAHQIFISGAAGYILKSAEKKEFINAIRTVYKGEKFFTRSMSDVTAKNYRNKSQSSIPITRREKEILRLIVDGLTNQAIAEKLFISPRTVDTHRSNLMQKLEIKNTAGLVRFAIENGIVSP